MSDAHASFSEHFLDIAEAQSESCIELRWNDG